MTIPMLETLDNAICNILETPISLTLTFGHTEIRFSFSFKAPTQLKALVDNVESDNKSGKPNLLPIKRTSSWN